jgi:tetratricopeptide (TPR) repeat protein
MRQGRSRLSVASVAFVAFSFEARADTVGVVTAPPTNATPLVDRLERAGEGARAVALEIVAALETASSPFRYQLAVMLTDRKLLRWVPFLAPHVLERVESPGEAALWRAFDAEASFRSLDYARADEEALKVVNMKLGGTPEEVGARTRALMVLAYVRDAGGDHGAASAWYRQALAATLPFQRAELLLDRAFALSKQGRYDESLEVFDQAEVALTNIGEPRASSWKAQILSGRAAVFDAMGNPAHALMLQRDALVLAESVVDRETMLASSLRLVRHLAALQRFDEAFVKIDALSELASTERQGRFRLPHERARLFRARRAWREARVEYERTIDELPEDASELVRGNLDVWQEITSGLADVFEELRETALASQASAAHAAAERLATARGLHRGDHLERMRLAERAAAAAAELRQALRAGPGDRVETTDFVINFAGGALVRRSTGDPTPLTALDVAILRHLSTLADGKLASPTDLAGALRKAKIATGSAKGMKHVIDRVRRRLGLGKGELIQGKSGPTGNGYRLVR